MLPNHNVDCFMSILRSSGVEDISRGTKRIDERRKYLLPPCPILLRSQHSSKHFVYFNLLTGKNGFHRVIPACTRKSTSDPITRVTVSYWSTHTETYKPHALKSFPLPCTLASFYVGWRFFSTIVRKTPIGFSEVEHAWNFRENKHEELTSDQNWRARSNGRTSFSKVVHL